MKHDEFMTEALNEAKIAYKKNEVPIGAIIVVDGKIIARGHNLRETLETTASHAEMIAIDNANQATGFWRLEDATLYTTVEPCMMCAGTIVQARIRRVVYGTRDYKAGCGGTIYNLLQDSRFNHQCEVIQGVLEEECQNLMSQFFKQLRERKKNQRDKIKNY